MTLEQGEVRGGSSRAYALGALTAGVGIAMGAGRVGVGKAAVSAEISDEALVVRGGTNTAERVAAGAESIDDAGLAHGVSVNSKSGASLVELTSGIPHNKIGVTTAGAIRAAGGQILPDATATNVYHCLVSCISPETLSKLLTPVIKNPPK